MKPSPNLVHVVGRAGACETGICVDGPLRGQRVARGGGGAWFPAGRATPRESTEAVRAAFLSGGLVSPLDAQAGDIFADIFGGARAARPAP